MMKRPKPLPPPSNLELRNELARLRARAAVHDAIVILFDCWPNLNRQQQAETANIVTILQEMETKLSNLKVIDSLPDLEPTL
jgi:hypothetical protein